MPHEILTKKLHDFSLPLNTVEEEHERRIVTAVVRKLSQLAEDGLFRVYKVRRHEGNFVLDLIAHAGPKVGIRPTIWIDKIQKKGALSWCLDYGPNERGFWVENIRSAVEVGKLRNKLTNKEIGEDYTDFIEDPSAIVAIPLRSTNESIIGVLAVQFEKDREISNLFVEILITISSEIARIMRKASETYNYIRNSTDAVEGFLDDILDIELSPDLLSKKPAVGFIARPFSHEFNEIGERVEAYFKEKNIMVSTFDPDRAGGIAAEQIVAQIKASRFGIADITGLNPNVLMEIGVMIAEGKHVVILKKFDDSPKIPFNVSGYYAHLYRVTPSGEIEAKKPDENVFRPFPEVLGDALSEFQGD